ncbi:MAG: CHAT domain-containing protein [Thiomargarita sp.]|nr:CHAT domain-containing protein [Thiomargarita sp.]
MKMINIPSYFKWLLFSALLVSFPFYAQAESEASAILQLLEQLTQQSANTQAQTKSQSQQKWHILDEIMKSRSSSNPFNALLGGLVGVNCEKKDAEIQKDLLVPLKMIAHFLPRGGIESSGETAEEMANQIFPTFSPNKTTFPQQPLIIEAIKDVIPIYKQTIASVVKRCGIKHIRVGRGLNFLAELYRSTNDYEQAKYALLDALQIMTTQPKYANDPDTGAIYNHLGIVYGLIGNHSKAEEFLKKAVALGEDVLGLNHPDTVSGLINLASVYTVLGKYDKAEESFEKALTAILDLKPRKLSEAKGLENEIRGRFEGAEEVVVRQNAAHFYAMLGNYDKAETLLQESLKLINNAQKRPHFFKAGIYHGLAYVYQQKADYERAIEHYEKALSIYQRLPAWKHSSLSVSTLSQFGYAYYLQQDIQKAEQYLQQAVDLSSKVPGSVYTRELVLGSSFLYLGWFYQGIQQFDKAEEVLQKARQFYENNLGKEHSAVIESLQHLTALKFDQGKIEEAVRLTKQVQSSSEKLRKEILSFATEQQRLAYQKLSHPYDLLARMANKTGDSIPLANAILHNKGIVLDSLMEDFQLRATPEKKAEIQQLKRRWTNLTLSFPEDKSRTAQRKRLFEKDKIERDLKKLISDLSPKIGQAHKAFDIQYQDVQKVLPKDTVLVEFIRYNHFIGRREGKAYYGAVLIPKQGEPKWVFLGEAKTIEQQIVDYQRMMRCGKKCQQYEEETVIKILETLYQRIWMPIEKQLPKRTQSVILSPDGELNFVSFATLLTPQSELEFLVQKFDLYYVASGRDLLRKTKRFNDKSMAIYALDDWKTHPAKERKQIASSIQNPVIREAYLYLPLKHLKGIEPEVNALEKMAKTQQWTVETFFNSEATEKRLYDLDHSPHILHFATHGVFLHPKPGSFKTDFFPTSSLNFREIPLKFLSNPMRRSFITLAGAQMTLDAWNKDKNSPFPAENDGILTAEEVSLINLENTWLTMFSACETGRGEGRAGEGVLGLRRGFVQAGTENLLMTLWPFPDNLSPVREFEVEFYQEAIRTQNAPKALNDVQRKWFLKIWENEEPIISTEILLDIVRLFGPYVVSFQGKL